MRRGEEEIVWSWQIEGEVPMTHSSSPLAVMPEFALSRPPPLSPYMPPESSSVHFEVDSSVLDGIPGPSRARDEDEVVIVFEVPPYESKNVCTADDDMESVVVVSRTNDSDDRSWTPHNRGRKRKKNENKKKDGKKGKMLYI